MQAGRVGRAHGLDGSFYVTRPRARLLSLGATVTVAGRAVQIVRRAGSDARPIVRVQGVEDRAGAEALRGQALTVANADAPELPEGEWWAHQLAGCRVFDGNRSVGVVTRLVELPSCEALEVRLKTGAQGDEQTGAQGDEQTGEPADGQTGETMGEPGKVGEQRGEPGSLLVPMVKDAIRSVDVEAGVIDVNMDFIEE